MITDVICKIYFTLFIDARGNLNLTVIKLGCVCSWSALGTPTENLGIHLHSLLPNSTPHKLLEVHNFSLWYVWLLLFTADEMYNFIHTN